MIATQKIKLSEIENELWKDIAGYENIYHVSNWGRIKSLPKKMGKGNGYMSSEKILKPGIDMSGYCIITLCKDKIHTTKTIHRLVAIAFNGDSKLQVNHKNGNKKDNLLSNLEFVSASENVQHAIKNNLLVCINVPSFLKAIELASRR